MSNELYRHKPEWLKIRLPRGVKSAHVCGVLANSHINTICSSGLCPNRGECWGAGTATFMIGGNICSRNCRFCNVASGRPLPLDPEEPQQVARSVKELALRHAVITSVDRDDLPDLGAAHWAATIRAIRAECPGVTMEVLIPDFAARPELLDMIVAEHPEVVSHNMETVRRLTPSVRSVATYDRSLQTLTYLASRGMRTKSGIMLGLGETDREILETMDDLRRAGVEVLTIGQYLQPTERHYPVQAYITPEHFALLGQAARDKGFRHVESAPFVRSSFHAERHIL